MVRKVGFRKMIRLRFIKFEHLQDNTVFMRLRSCLPCLAILPQSL